MRQWSFIETHPQERVKNKMSNCPGGGGGWVAFFQGALTMDLN